jgi:phenylalanyl-tRNA synthetase beta chain
MLISLSWLKKYVDIPVDTKKFVEELTMLGLNVERSVTSGIEGDDVVIGRVVEVSPHPNADRLRVCQVQVGAQETLEIVCGAANVAGGQFVPVALIGATLHNGLKIKKSKIRGVVSNGMICSEIELGLGDDADGIIVLDGTHQPGTRAADALGGSDTVLEIEVTPNRPDQLSHIGVAREVGALYSTPVRYPSVDVGEGDGGNNLSIRIDDPSDCFRYVGRVVRGVEVGPSPAWLVTALESLGQGSINSVVDAANYVMLETGQPLHAFDIDKLGGLEIGVRRARRGETLRALDDVDYKLDDHYLIITEGDGPVAIAGVIGGMDSGVTTETRNILIESAAFDPRVVRKTRRSMNISTEASYRFERGSDREGCRLSADRACALIVELAGGKAGEVEDVYPSPFSPRSVEIRSSNTKRILGVELETSDIAGYLERLHFELEDADAERVKVSIPSYRNDVLEEMDLIEEVARMHGYDRIGKGWSFRTTTYAQLDPFDEFCDQVADHLAARGYTEMVTSSFTDGSEAELMGWRPSDPRNRMISIRNPLTSNQTYLRTSPLPGVLELIRKNIDYGVRDVAVYSIGRVYLQVPLPAAEEAAGSGSSGLPDERVMLVIARTRPSGYDFWNDSKQTVDLFDIKAEIETLVLSQNIDIFGRLSYDFDDPGGRFAYTERHDTVIEGGIVPARLAAKYQLEHAVWYAIIDLARMLQLRAGHNRFKPLPEYPVSKRDLSLVTPPEVTFAQVEKCLVKHGGRLLESVQAFDVYSGNSLVVGSTAFGARLLFRSAERTLRDSEIDKIVEKVIQKLQGELGVTLRA